MSEDAGDTPQQCLTPAENAAIIAALYAAEAREKRAARQIVGLQVAITLVVAGIAVGFGSTAQIALAVLGGGMISVLNSALLAWRMSRAAVHSARGEHSRDANYQLRLMYFYTAERFLVVIVLLGFCMAALKLPPLALMGGFVMGQAVLLLSRLILSRFKTEIVTKNV
ncbi:MAG: ATP synthase subunit I [Gallionella sp.]|nr:ATP synthase subunit I [Gallionella sp.]